MSVDTVSYQDFIKILYPTHLENFIKKTELLILVLKIKIKEIAVHRAEVVLIGVGKTIIKVSYHLT